jgi:hypothetical protein
MDEAAGRDLLAEAADQGVSTGTLGGTDGVGVPLTALEIVNGHEGGFAAHGEANIVLFQHGVDMLAKGVETLPAGIGKGVGDARMLGDARHLHVEREAGVDLTDGGEGAGNGGGVAVMRRCGEGDVALAGEEAGGGIEADPACAGQVNLAPSV